MAMKWQIPKLFGALALSALSTMVGILPAAV